MSSHINFVSVILRNFMKEFLEECSQFQVSLWENRLEFSLEARLVRRRTIFIDAICVETMKASSSLLPKCSV